MTRVLIVGSGGVGTMAALTLSSKEHVEVTLVVRSDYDLVTLKGYTFNSVSFGVIEGWRPQHVAKSVEEAAENGPFDFIVLSTKNVPDGPTTCEDIIRPAVKIGKTAIVMIQNGLGIEGPMLREFPGCVILSGVSLIGLTNLGGVIKHSHRDLLLLSAFDNPSVPKAECVRVAKQFQELYQHADPAMNNVVLEDDAQQSRWEKLVYNSVLNTVCTISGLDVNRCQINGANEGIFGLAMDEVYAIARSTGVEIRPELKSYYQHIGDGLFYLPSMLVDLRKKQLLELEVILGNPLQIARKNNVPVPILSTIYQLLKMIQFRVKEERGMVNVDEAAYKGVSSDDYPSFFENSQKEV